MQHDNFFNKDYKKGIRMKTSKNYNLGVNKFFNISKGKRENKFLFFLPTVIVSPKHFLSWDTVMFSVFIVWGRYFIQFNICEIVKNTNIEIFKETVMTLVKFLKGLHLEISDNNAALGFLNKNPHVIQVLKNANLEHPYIKNVLSSTFHNQSFVKTKVQ